MGRLPSFDAIKFGLLRSAFLQLLKDLVRRLLSDGFLRVFLDLLKIDLRGIPVHCRHEAGHRDTDDEHRSE